MPFFISQPYRIIDEICSDMHSYLHSAIHFLEGYHGEQPMHLALKQFFRTDKKYGSRDRKWIGNLCFARMRTYRQFIHLPDEDALLCSLLLTLQEPERVLIQIFAGSSWMISEEVITATVAVKLQWLQQEKGIVLSDEVFPMQENLSAMTSQDQFLQSLFQQPLVWMRCAKGKKDQVMRKLEASSLPYISNKQFPEAIGLQPGVKLEEAGILDSGWAEIQDLSSQQALNDIVPKPGEKWYDACAASGGKSLLLMEKQPAVELTVSDIRPAMLENLKVRFQRNGVGNYTAFSSDLSKADSLLRYTGYFDGIIADVPCSGSGTWGRTPEQMCFFSSEKLQHYVALQRSILLQLVSALKPGGKLVYITCSVYRDENESQVAFLEQEGKLKCSNYRLIEGYHHRADTMFTAVFLKE